MNLIEEKRLTVLCHGQCYQKHIAWVFDKKVKPSIFRGAVLVLMRILPFREDRYEKFKPTYEDAYAITKVL